MEMVKTTIVSVNPETKEIQNHTLESEAVCAVTVKGKGDEKIEVSQAIVGAMNAHTTHAMIKALIGACGEILKDTDPMIAALILSTELDRVFGDEKGGDEDVAGTSDEPERPSEQ